MLVDRSSVPGQIPQHLNRISGEIVDAAIKVHTHLGPGLLENVYETCLSFEMEKRGHKVERQVQLGVNYDGVSLEIGFRLDLLIDSEVIGELLLLPLAASGRRSPLVSPEARALRPNGRSRWPRLHARNACVDGEGLGRRSTPCVRSGSSLRHEGRPPLCPSVFSVSLW